MIHLLQIRKKKPREELELVAGISGFLWGFLKEDRRNRERDPAGGLRVEREDEKKPRRLLGLRLGIGKGKEKYQREEAHWVFTWSEIHRGLISRLLNPKPNFLHSSLSLPRLSRFTLPLSVGSPAAFYLLESRWPPFLPSTFDKNRGLLHKQFERCSARFLKDILCTADQGRSTKDLRKGSDRPGLIRGIPFSFYKVLKAASLHKLGRKKLVRSSVKRAEMRPRWKGKGLEAKALAEPMSKIVQQLQSSLKRSQTHGFLSGCSVLLEADPEQAHLLNMACFGRPIVTSEKDKQWIQFGFEEAFYLCHSLKCLQILGMEDNCAKKEEEVWTYMNSKRTEFPDFYKAYSHLRMKNWVVRPGSQYGVDFVAYRHHPALVHSEYAVVVLSEGGENRRLRVWSDLEGTIRLCGSVAKTLLVLSISSNGSDLVFPSCLEQYSVQEHTHARWNPEQTRENHLVLRNGVSEAN
ncbi:hypothetical protein NE237_030588 [Protea cynaroides]|uniref:tRNA-intron lyase n=1 Tax=Protea cynaroides TaxID=273540 RepID=A0A9Q0GVC6_9MAGN|nr:hypothetical protein NE237_030588 [Protea cynaroides]